MLLISADELDNFLIEKIDLAEKYRKEGNKSEAARIYTQIGYYLIDKNNSKSIEFFIKALEINKELNNRNAIKVLCNNVGDLYYKIGNNKLALEYYTESYEINKKFGNKENLITDILKISQIYNDLKNYQKEKEMLEEALTYSIELNDLQKIHECLSRLSITYEILGDKSKSLEYQEKALAIYKKLNQQKIKDLEEKKKNIEEKIKTTEDNLKYTYDSLTKIKRNYEEIQTYARLKESENKIKDLLLKQEKHKAQQNKILLLYSTIGLLVLLLSTILIFSQYRQKKTALKLLEENKKEIEKQRDIANKQNRKIKDSIIYAQRIQSAILPPDNFIDNILNEYFIIYIPRDIVSGDFYYVNKKENIIIIAVADCTGHGVPGALMSMLGFAFLNEIINKTVYNKHIKNLHTDEILNELREYIINSMHQKGSGNEPLDGMDIALVFIDTESHILEFSGAHNPVYIIRKGQLIEFQGDKMPISYHPKKDIPFTKHNIKLEDNDLIYLFTDGYVDQFGGQNGSKFLYTNFKNLLKSLYNEPLNIQKEKLINAYNEWKGDYDQVDDICILGFKYKKNLRSEIQRIYDWSDKTILIVEDIDINYYLLVEALKSTGVKIHRAINGQHAIEILQSLTPDLILMDIYMPVMNGYEATRIIKQQYPNIPIIMQTALDSGQELQLSIEAGADDYISKPIDFKTFLKKIKNYIHDN